MNRFRFLIVIFCLVMLASCDDDDSVAAPKPRGYFRIALPPKKYVAYDAECPFTFDIPDYSHIFHSAAPNADPCWRDLYFIPFNATLYLSYKDVNSDTMLHQLINQSWELTEAHNQVAQGMRDSAVSRPDAHVYGSIELLSGNAATPLQFYFTDSTRHFLRGSLYFYAVPNKDSIAPVLKYIESDIYHIASTLRWKDTPLPDDKHFRDSMMALKSPGH